MKTKIVYTLACKENCVYFAQAALSAFSAKKYCENAEILLVVDSQTGAIIEKYKGLRTYFTQIVQVEVPIDLTTKQKSRYLKTKLRNFIKGDYLYIDTDTIICSDLSDVDNFEMTIAAVIDCNSDIYSHNLKNKIASDIDRIGLNLNDLHNKYFNSGLIFVKDNPLAIQLYDKWYEYWNESRLQGLDIDQPALAKANKDCGYPITEISGIWNCQLRENFINLLNEAKILHYFASNDRSPYSLFDIKIYTNVLENDQIPVTIQKQLDHPKELFRQKHMLVHDDDVDYIRSSIYTMFSYHRWFFNILDFVSRNIIRLFKSFDKK